MSRTIFLLFTFAFAAANCGCLAIGRPAVANPFFVPANNQYAVWERAVDVLYDYQFPISEENQLSNIIQTDYKVGSGLLEPWHRDSVGFQNRVESSLQSIRRMAQVSLTPVEGGYLVGVQVFKEQEDLDGTATNSAGSATFQESTPLDRDLDVVVGQSTPSGWIPIGRDAALEQSMLNRLQANFTR